MVQGAIVPLLYPSRAKPTHQCHLERRPKAEVERSPRQCRRGLRLPFAHFVNFQKSCNLSDPSIVLLHKRQSALGSQSSDVLSLLVEKLWAFTLHFCLFRLVFARLLYIV